MIINVYVNIDLQYTYSSTLWASVAFHEHLFMGLPFYETYFFCWTGFSCENWSSLKGCICLPSIFIAGVNFLQMLNFFSFIIIIIIIIIPLMSDCFKRDKSPHYI